MSYYKRILRVIAFLSMLSLCIQLTSFAHPYRAGTVIKGVVQNNASLPIPGVKVVLHNAKTNFTSGTITDNSGEFSFTRVPVDGAYSFTFTTSGYETQRLSGYTIREEVTLSIIVKMNSRATKTIMQEETRRIILQ